MFTEQEILKLTKDKAVLYKGKKDKPIQFNEGYLDAIKYKKRIAVHSDEDVFPEDLYINRSPNQTQKELDYMRANHKAITYIVWDKFTSAIARIWNDKNWSIQNWGKVDSKFNDASPQAYFEKYYPVGGSLEEYYKDIVTDTKEKDPNAVLVHYPQEIPTVENSDGSLSFDESIMINPIAHIYGCERVIDFKEGNFCLIELPEKSPVKKADKTVIEGLMYEFYDQVAIYKVNQVGEKEDYNFEVILYYRHDLEFLPCTKLKARPKVKDRNILYKSHFAPACEHLDLALLDNGYLTVSKARHAFPKWWEYATKCEYQDNDGICDRGIIRTSSGKDHVCPSCNGSGFARSLSPFESIQIPVPDSLNPTQLQGTPGGFIQPDIESPRFLREEIDKHIANGAAILNLSDSSSDVKGSDTALGKQIDREQMFSFLLKISGQVFSLFEFSLMTIQKMRYGKNAEPPTLAYPKNFAIRNEEDLTSEIAAAKEKGMPDIIIRELIEEYLSTRFSAQENIKDVIDLVFFTDRLATLSSLEIANKKASGSIANWEDILHTSIYSFIEHQISLNENFMELSNEERYTILVDKAKSYANEISAKAIKPDSILANANAE
jgi:hypothetical protein